jgi:L-arabinose isomerase
MNRWAELAPTHHVALGVGHVADAVQNAAKLIGLECVRA